MVETLIIIFIVGFVIVIIAGIVSGIRQSLEEGNRRSSNSGLRKYESNHTPNVEFSEEERQFIENVSVYCWVSRVTDADIRKYNIHIITECFLAMPGWDMWDPSIHEALGQYERMARSQDKNISILAYDPNYELAKVHGTSSTYLTSYKRCSCPDYKKRRMPCKHMYALATELDGDSSKSIKDEQNKPLYGLRFALGGFRGKRDDVDGIRAKVNRRGGIWSDDILEETDALILGSFPSDRKKSIAETMDLAIFDEATILEVFS